MSLLSSVHHSIGIPKEYVVETMLSVPHEDDIKRRSSSKSVRMLRVPRSEHGLQNFAEKKSFRRRTISSLSHLGRLAKKQCSHNSQEEACHGSAPTAIHLNCNHTISVCLLGSSRVGKTAIVRKIKGLDFDEKHIPTTYEHYVVNTCVNNIKVLLDLQDLSGSMNFPAMEGRALENANVVLLVFALDDFNSCQYAVHTSIEFEENDDFKAPIILVGNKSDLMGDENREKINEFITNSVQRTYVEMSAKKDLDASFLLKCIYEEHEIARGPYRTKRVKKRGVFRRKLKKMGYWCCCRCC